MKELGDGLFLWFPEPDSALRCALELHRILDEEAATTGLPLWIRVGMHHGHALQRGADLVGNDVNVAARIVDVAAPGEVLVSDCRARRSAVAPVSGGLRGARTRRDEGHPGADPALAGDERLRPRRTSVEVGPGAGVGLPEASGHRREELLGERRDLVQHGGEALLLEHVEPTLAERPDGRRPGAAVEEGELAEEVTGAQLGDGVPAVLDRRFPARDHVELVTRLTLGAEHVAGRHLLRVHHQGDAVELGRQEPGEQGDLAHERLQLSQLGHARGSYYGRRRGAPATIPSHGLTAAVALLLALAACSTDDDDSPDETPLTLYQETVLMDPTPTTAP